MGNEVYRVRSLDVLNALCKAAKLIGKAGVPDGFVFCHLGEMAIFERLSGRFINDGANECLLRCMCPLRKFKHVRCHGISPCVLPDAVFHATRGYLFLP